MPSKPWQTKAWRDKRKGYLEDKKCEWCGTTERLVIHHPTYINPDGSSISPEQYMDWENTKVQVLCRKCHTNYHKGRIRCKVCKDHWHDPKYDSCWTCFIATPKGQATTDRIMEDKYEDRIIKETNPICGKTFEIENWRLERHGGLPAFCYIICGDACSCNIFQKWKSGDLPEEETADPEYFRKEREFNDRLDQLTEAGMDIEEAVELLRKEFNI
jgi:hypothetical protein